MIEILKCTDESVISDFGFEKSDNLVVMTAADKSDIFGAGAVEIFGDIAVFKEIKIKDEFKMLGLEHGMGKSLLNLADLAGVLFVFSDSCDERLMKMLRFKENTVEMRQDSGFNKEGYDGFKYFLSLSGYFTVHGCDSCKGE